MAETLTLPTVTVDDLLRWIPCQDWTEERIREIAGDKQRWNAIEVIEHLESRPYVGMSPEHILWPILRPEMIPSHLLHEIICRFVEHILMREREQGREPDRRSWASIAAKRAWLRGKVTDAELGATQDAAWAVWKAAKEVALLADAAVDAEEWVSARAARAAAWALGLKAIRNATWITSEIKCKEQLRIVKEVLNES